MSIGNNTTGLQRILQAVNELPDGGSGGVTVQRVSDSFTTNTSGTATIDCGFRPDLIIINGLISDDFETDSQACFCFPERSNSSYDALGMGVSDTYGYGLDFVFTQLSTGFSVTVTKYDSNWDSSVVSRGSFNYVAIKYTA